MDGVCRGGDIGMKIGDATGSARFYEQWALEEGFEFLLLEPFHDFGYVLGAAAGAEEEGVVGFDQDQVMDAEGGNEFFGGPEKIARGVGGESGAGGKVSAGFGEQLVYGVPGADVAPADGGGDDGHRNVGIAGFASGFDEGVIDRDIFELGINFL